MQDYSTLRRQILHNIVNDKDVMSAVKSYEKNYKYGQLKYTDATQLAKKMSKAISNSIAQNIIENDLEGYVEQVVAPVYRNAQKTILGASKSIQKSLSAEYGLGIAPVDIDTDESRIKHIIERFKEAESLDDVSFLLGEDVIENILHSAVTDSIRENAKRFDDAGFDSYVTRTDGSGCCDWCSSMVGTYELDSLPNDFWAVHKGCTCQFNYKAKGRHNKITFSTGEDGRMHKNTESI